MSDNSDTMK